MQKCDHKDWEEDDQWQSISDGMSQQESLMREENALMREMLSEMKQQNQVLNQVLEANAPRGLDDSFTSQSSYASSVTASSTAEPLHAPRHYARPDAHLPDAPRHNGRSEKGRPMTPAMDVTSRIREPYPYNPRDSLESLSSFESSARGYPSDVSDSQRSFASENTYASSREAIFAAARDRPFFLPKHMVNSIKQRKDQSVSSHSSSSRSSSTNSRSPEEACESKSYSSVYVKQRHRSKPHGRSKSRDRSNEPDTAWGEAYKEFRGFCGWNK